MRCRVLWATCLACRPPRDERFLLAGHDWGGIVAWACAMAHPDRIGRAASKRVQELYAHASDTSTAQLLHIFHAAALAARIPIQGREFPVYDGGTHPNEPSRDFFRTGFRTLSRSVAAALSTNGHDQLVPPAAHHWQTHRQPHDRTSRKNSLGRARSFSCERNGGIEPGTAPWICLQEGRRPYAFANISARKISPVLIIAQMIRASLLASATVTRRAGFFARSADHRRCAGVRAGV
jgi:pimeloyl-ACP methyl ester carboxylesterase